MSKFLTPESVAMRPDASHFSAKRLTMLRQIFDTVCKEENVVSLAQRDDLALNLLLASKFTDDEHTLAAVMRYDIAGLRK